VYGRTKLEGEELIRQSGARHLILRTSWVYATHGGNFVKTMLRLAAERESLNVISDQIGAPTGAELLADVTAHAIRTIQGQYQGRGQTTTSFVHATAPLQGTFHCVAAGETSWFDYARFIIEWARSEGQPIKVAPDAILPIPTSSYPTPAQRPLNSRLDSSRLRDAYGLELPDWRRGVVRMLREFVRSQGSSKLVRPD
jgi:dTDP-4-dehydrorhamnose reductase